MTTIEIPDAHADAADAFADGFAAGATAERERIAAILDGDAGKERPALARKLAMMTDMPADDAAEIMADLPAEKPVSRIPSLAQRHADAGPGAGAEGPGGTEAAARDFGASVGAGALWRRTIDRAAGTTPKRKD